MSRIRKIFRAIQKWNRHRKFPEGVTLTRFIARDVRREILIVSSRRIDEGVVTARVRTTNVLYRTHGLAAQTDFEPARELCVDQMWNWPGQGWGLADGTSIVDHLPPKKED
ncbi:MAG TPA: hypothetical protein VGH90_02485 [Chthoniobacteraceae bacterium]|jgi:hypothetical protein